MRRIVTMVLIGGALALAVFAWMMSSGPPAAAQEPGSPPPGGPPPMRPGGPGGGRGFFTTPIDSFAAERDSLMNEVLDRIQGKEQMPAESVFRNIKVMKGVPAGRLVRIMNLGYGRSLGVKCEHCHVQGHYADEDKPQKQVARDMGELVRTINEELLPKIKHLQSEHPGVNCGTCHHGVARPGFGPEMRPGGPGGPPPGGGGNH